MLRRLSLPVKISIDISRSLHWNPAPSRTPAASQTVAWSTPDALWPLSETNRSQQKSDVETSEPCSSSQPADDASGDLPSSSSIRGAGRRASLPPRLPKGLSKLHLQIMQTIRSRELLQPKSSILIAVSGGQVQLLAVVADRNVSLPCLLGYLDLYKLAQ